MSRPQRRLESHSSLLRIAPALAVAVLVYGCAQQPVVQQAGEPPQAAAPPFEPKAQGELIGYDEDFAVVSVTKEDDLESLAKRYLRSKDKAWWIAEFNGIDRVKPGQIVAIPLRPRNQPGVGPKGTQAVPVLCYHRFGARSDRLVVRPDAFAAQMAWLWQNNFRVVTLAELQAFLEGQQALPEKSVAITIDDGYRSTYDIAFPILQKYGYPATVFLYTGFVGASDALTWVQMQEMMRSGIIDIQPHSKTHANLSVRRPGESDAAYRDRIREEIEAPKSAIHDKLRAEVRSYAFPYGDTSDMVTEQLARQNIRYGFTVTPGGNTYFAYPFMLRRTMIYGEDDLDRFAGKVSILGKPGVR